jgi:hypothetical protein
MGAPFAMASLKPAGMPMLFLDVDRFVTKTLTVKVLQMDVQSARDSAKNVTTQWLAITNATYRVLQTRTAQSRQMAAHIAIRTQTMYVPSQM